MMAGPTPTDVNALSVTTTATAWPAAAPRFRCSPTRRRRSPAQSARSSRRAWGFAGRVAVNPALLGDPSKLTLYSSSTSSGDPTRPNFIYQQLTNASFAFSARSGLGSAGSPFTGSVPAFLQQLLSTQGEAAANAASLAQGQDVVVNALQQRLNDASGVNVDQEMAN